MKNDLVMGERIRKQRMLLGLTRVQLAEGIGKSVKFVSDIETGTKGFSIQTLANLTDILNVSSDYILFGSENSYDTVVELGKKCPKKYRNNLVGMVKLFIDSVSDDDNER